MDNKIDLTDDGNDRGRFGLNLDPKTYAKSIDEWCSENQIYSVDRPNHLQLQKVLRYSEATRETCLVLHFQNSPDVIKSCSGNLPHEVKKTNFTQFILVCTHLL